MVIKPKTSSILVIRAKIPTVPTATPRTHALVSESGESTTALSGRASHRITNGTPDRQEVNA